MERAICVQVAANRVGMKGHKNDVDQRGRYNSQVDILFGVVFKYLFQIEDAVSHGEMASPRRLAVYKMKLINVLLRFAKRRIGNNGEQQSRHRIVLQGFTPLLWPWDARADCAVGKNWDLGNRSRGC